MIDITPIVEALIGLLSAIIVCVVIPYIKGKTNAQQQAEIAQWINIAVAAAEQIYKGSGRGAEKKQYVLDWLNANGMKCDDAAVEALIEAAVFDLNGGKKNE